MALWDIREAVCEVGRRCWSRQFVASNDGNISHRLGQDTVLCTPTMISKGFMAPMDLVLADMRGRQLLGDRDLTSEIRLHLRIYKKRPDVASVVHVHAPHALAFAAAGRHLPRAVLAEFEWNVGALPLVPWKMPGTWDFARSVDPWIETHDVLALENHGIVAAGADPFDAYYKVECVDAYARIMLLALGAGLEPKKMGAEKLATVIAAKCAVGLADQDAGEAYAARIAEAVSPRQAAVRRQHRWPRWNGRFPQVEDAPKLSTAPSPKPMPREDSVRREVRELVRVELEKEMAAGA